MRKLIIIIISLLLFVACNRNSQLPPGVTEIPLVTGFHASNDTFHFKDTTDIVYFNFTIWDADKDFGNETSDSAIILQDFRSGELYQTFVLPLPTIPREVLKKNYLEARVTLPLKSVIFTPRADSLHIATRKDTATFKLFVQDEGKHISEVVEAGTFYITE